MSNTTTRLVIQLMGNHSHPNTSVVNIVSVKPSRGRCYRNPDMINDSRFLNIKENAFFTRPNTEVLSQPKSCFTGLWSEAADAIGYISRNRLFSACRYCN